MIVSIKLFIIFFKVGLFAFGGGYVILPMIYQDIQTLGIMSAHEFSNVVALSQVTPGPIAINAATYVGYQIAGIWGATIATLGVTLPSFIIILTISAFLNKFKTSPVVEAVLSGIRPATVGLIATAVLFFAETSIIQKGFLSFKMLNNPLNYIDLPALLIFVLTLIGSQKFKISPITLTLLAGIMGIVIL